MKTFKNLITIISVIALIFSFTLVSSCREDAKKEETQTETTSTKTPVETKAKTPATNEAIAKNPAHGQPGHRCDIPVGAPLNSPATNTNSGSPVNNSSSNNATGKVNPPHGQPGHRCDVKVGDPL
ncbi:MAG: hypothetical protein KJO39_11830 [Bacteroidia bacterium]|nr:hypothetical protein [Bacteroidia bacterium]NNF31854.1 hypothetical protein [Flavobacteriaceae bacterium]NNK53030.1 hypothetical protein [Flavobacteriaceae bacterium]NNM07767.1 hypothetical protein [Flavobacteriaceae bacterium]